MRIVINTIPHKDQTYDTCGNWYWDHEGTLQVQVSELNDVDSEIDVAIHEIIEARLCQKHGITDNEVTRHDIKFEKEREEGIHPLDAEPGDDPRSPYRTEHQSAEFVERAANSVLGPDWPEYERKIQGL